MVSTHRVAGGRTTASSGLGRGRSGHIGSGRPRVQAAEMITEKFTSPSPILHHPQTSQANNVLEHPLRRRHRHSSRRRRTHDTSAPRPKAEPRARGRGEVGRRVDGRVQGRNKECAGGNHCVRGGDGQDGRGGGRDDDDGGEGSARLEHFDAEPHV